MIGLKIRLFRNMIKSMSITSKIPQKTKIERIVDCNIEVSQIINTAESPRNTSDSNETAINPNKP